MLFVGRLYPRKTDLAHVLFIAPFDSLDAPSRTLAADAVQEQIHRAEPSNRLRQLDTGEGAVFGFFLLIAGQLAIINQVFVGRQQNVRPTAFSAALSCYCSS